MTKIIKNKSDKWAAISADRVVYTAKQPFKLAPKGTKGDWARLTFEQGEQLQAMIEEDKESENPKGLDDIFELDDIVDDAADSETEVPAEDGGADDAPADEVVDETEK